LFRDFAAKTFVNTDLSFIRCACCRGLHVVHIEATGTSYCDRCEVAYLEFKLGLLLAACRAPRRTGEV